MDFIIGLVAGSLIHLFCYFVFYSKRIRQTEKFNSDVRQKNHQLEEQRRDLISELKAIEDRIQQENTHFKNLFEQSQLTFDNLYQTEKEKLDLKLKTLKTEEEEKYNQAINEYRNEYLNVLEDLTQTSKEHREEVKKVIEELHRVKELKNANIEALKREEKIKKEKDFFRLILSENDLSDIKQLKSIERYLVNKEILNKIIWKVYFETPFTNLIGRVIGNKEVSGIYKITNLIDEKCYIGQAVNIKDRWKTHIKRGLGCETGPQLKIYSAMLESGIENFTWEILKECPRNELSEQEKYWIELYQTNTYGYNMTKGG